MRLQTELAIDYQFQFKDLLKGIECKNSPSRSCKHDSRYSSENKAKKSVRNCGFINKIYGYICNEMFFLSEKDEQRANM